MRFIFIGFLTLCSSAFTQNYWQQEVNYTIEVKLDDKSHTLTGYEEFEYINNSPDALNRIYVHIWPNAYKDGNTALAKQLYKNGDDALKYADDESKGNIDSLDFKINGDPVKWFYHHHEDIAVLELPLPLLPGERLLVSTPFKVKIPSGAISRLGHIGQSYQITQWYPKPAVYDKNGWHHMPYLNQGEFYSEYGSFDVSITLPENYVVAATGDLQTESEMEFLNKLADDTKAYFEKTSEKNLIKRETKTAAPASSATFKTIRYTQSNVHDFAWFADKTYKVLKGQVDLANSKRRITSWVMFTPQNEALWKNALEYVNDGTYYYSLWNGDYPYNNVTAVDGTISAGGGMEYPNITVIGNASSAHELEVVIVHEVGHNWFYGQLGTNERVHGWMDEGMNTLNEVRYIQTKYPDNTALSDMVMGGRFHFNDLDHHDLGDLSYRVMVGFGEDQPIETHSVEFSPGNYGVIMYQKTGLVFFYLKDYLGEDLFDECMKSYYLEWEFKHPQPEDMREVFERVSKRDLSWLFGDLIQTTKHIDYKIAKVKKHEGDYDVTVKNVGQVDGPIQVSTMKDGKVIETKWTKPGEKSTTLHFKGGFDRVSIDPEKDIPELYRQNNNWKSNGLFKKLEPAKVEFLLGDNEPNTTNIFWTPTIGGNVYDKFMVGVAVHNYGVPFPKFRYLVMPFYSVGRQFVSGVGEFSVLCRPEDNLKSSRLGLSIKSFKRDTVYRGNDSYFISVAPYWLANIGDRKKDSPITQTIRIQSIYKKDKLGPTHIEHAGAFIEYDYNFKKPDHKINLNLRNDYITNVNTSDQMARVMLETSYSYRYKKRRLKSWVSVRAFVGKQYISDFNKASGYQYSMSIAGTDGTQDLFVDEYYFGRYELNGMWSQQREENMGGFKSAAQYGTTSDWMTTGNLYFQLPVKPGIFGIFADLGAFWNDVSVSGSVPANEVGVVSVANVGLAMKLGDIFGIYFPVWMSDELENSFSSKDYATRIRFTLKFNFVNKPFSLGGLI